MNRSLPDDWLYNNDDILQLLRAAGTIEKHEKVNITSYRTNTLTTVGHSLEDFLGYEYFLWSVFPLLLRSSTRT